MGSDERDETQISGCQGHGGSHQGKRKDSKEREGGATDGRSFG